jgi:hypothetical protein
VRGVGFAQRSRLQAEDLHSSGGGATVGWFAGW